MHEQINVNDFIISILGAKKLLKVVENMKSIKICSEMNYSSNSYTSKTLFDKIVVNRDFEKFINPNYHFLANYNHLINYKFSEFFEFSEFKRMKEIKLWFYNDNKGKALEQIK